MAFSPVFPTRSGRRRAFAALFAAAWVLARPPAALASEFSCLKTFSGIGKGLRDFGAEVLDTQGRRLFFKDRQQGRKLKGLSWLNAMMMNPVATLRDAPREGTWLTTSIGYFVFLDLIPGVVDAWGEQEDVAAARELVKSNEIPGSAYVWDLMLSGFVSGRDGAQAILNHQELLRNWAENHSNSPLPRVFDLVKAGVIGSGEVSSLDELMRRVIQQSREEAVRRPGFEAKDFPAHLFEAFRKALASDPRFGKKSKTELELISTAFWPPVRGAKLTDIAAGKILFLEKKELPPYRQIADWADRNMLSIGEAYRMVEDLKKDPKLIQKREKKGVGIFPAGHAEPLERPEIPRFPDELSRWKVLFQDPRFVELKNSWLKRESPDIEVLGDLEVLQRGLNEILEADRKAGAAPLDDATVVRLFGDSGAGGNPLLVDSGKEVSLMASSRGLSEEQAFSCLKEAAEYWRAFHREEAKQVRGGASAEAFEEFRRKKSAQKREEYNELLKNCPHPKKETGQKPQ